MVEKIKSPFKGKKEGFKLNGEQLIYSKENFQKRGRKSFQTDVNGEGMLRLYLKPACNRGKGILTSKGKDLSCRTTSLVTHPISHGRGLAFKDKGKGRREKAVKSIRGGDRCNSQKF